MNIFIVLAFSFLNFASSHSASAYIDSADEAYAFSYSGPDAPHDNHVPANSGDESEEEEEEEEEETNERFSASSFRLTHPLNHVLAISVGNLHLATYLDLFKRPPKN